MEKHITSNLLLVSASEKKRIMSHSVSECTASAHIAPSDNEFFFSLFLLKERPSIGIGEYTLVAIFITFPVMSANAGSL